tara:strand:- start:356 stop:724 length:369 start_codon:yes stop_codon:yes gene_type:complete
MIKLKDMLKEGLAWDRKFGEPLPTLKDVVTKHQITEDDCGCNGHNTCGCEITESASDIPLGKKQLQKIMNSEGRLRENMYKLSDRLDSDSVNQKLSKKLKDSYKKNVTNFMRDAVKIVKDMK